MLNAVLFPLRFLLIKIRYLYYKQRLSKVGRGSIINSVLHINGGKNIEIGNNVTIDYKTWLAAIPLTGETKCLLRIGSDTRIGNFNHIFATKSILIEEKVLTADNVYISDNFHAYNNIELAIIDQPIIQNKEVVIGYGTWVGENVCILGAKIGRNCVIGANAVVNKDIPDFCVVVGIPAKIIKRYNSTSQKWEKTNPDGSFL